MPRGSGGGRKIVHVVRARNGWKVKEEGRPAPSKTYESKPPAIEKAKEIANDADKGPVKIHLDEDSILG